LVLFDIHVSTEPRNHTNVAAAHTGDSQKSMPTSIHAIIHLFCPLMLSPFLLDSCGSLVGLASLSVVPFSHYGPDYHPLRLRRRYHANTY